MRRAGTGRLGGHRRSGAQSSRPAGCARVIVRTEREFVLPAPQRELLLRRDEMQEPLLGAHGAVAVENAVAGGARDHGHVEANRAAVATAVVQHLAGCRPQRPRSQWRRLRDGRAHTAAIGGRGCGCRCGCCSCCGCRRRRCAETRGPRIAHVVRRRSVGSTGQERVMSVSRCRTSATTSMPSAVLRLASDAPVAQRQSQWQWQPQSSSSFTISADWRVQAGR